MKRKTTYPGELNKPIVWKGRFFPPPEIDDGKVVKFKRREQLQEDRKRSEVWEALDAKIEARFELLFKHYGISPKDPCCWELLARDLADVHVPGTKITFKNPQAGRPMTRHFWHKIWLVQQVDLILAELRAKPHKRGMRVAVGEAINKLIQDNQDTWIVKDGLSVATLASRYSEWKPWFDKIIEEGDRKGWGGLSTKTLGQEFP